MDPVTQCSGRVFALEGGTAGQRQRLHVVGVEQESPLDELRGLSARRAALQHGQHIGMIGQQLRAARTQPVGGGKGGAGFLEALQRRVGTRHDFPQRRVFGARLAGLQALRHAHDHELHLLAAHRHAAHWSPCCPCCTCREDRRCRHFHGTGQAALCLDHVRVAGPAVQHQHQRRYPQPNGPQAAGGLKRCIRSPRQPRLACAHGLHGFFVERTARNVLAGLPVLGFGQQAFGSVGVGLAQLLAQDGEVACTAVAVGAGFTASLGTGLRPRWCVAQQRRQQHQQRCAQHGQGDHPEQGHGRSRLSPSKRSARRRSASLRPPAAWPGGAVWLGWLG